MAFGFGGAAAGASNALQEMLAKAFAERQQQEQLALQQEAARRQQAAQEQQAAQFAQRQGLDERQFGLQQQQFDLDTQQTQTALDQKAEDRRMAGNQRGVRQLALEGLRMKSAQPRDVQLMASAEGVDIPMDVLDPEKDQRDRLEQIRVSGQEARATAGARPADERLVQVMGPQGTPIWVRESQAVGQPAAQAARAVTGQERQSLAYYNRAKQASETLATPDVSGTALEDRVAKSGLGTQLGLQYAPNMLQTADQQAYRQAQRAFTEARLRKESGAAIPTSEYENDARTYFAQPGDDADTVDQKRKARQTVLDGLKFGSGKAYNEFYGDEGSAPAPATPASPPVQKWGRDAQGRPVRLQ